MRNVSNAPGWWAAVIAWTAMIFWFSSQPDLRSGLETWQDLVLRKIAHALEYFTLAFFWAKAVGAGTITRLALGWGTVLALVTAIADETYQSTVRGRTGSPVDVAVDSIGIIALIFLFARRKTAL